MTLPATPNLGLARPEPSITTGPQWAQMLNDCLNTIDEHDHTAGRGKPIPAAGLNIDADLDFHNNDATSLRSTRYQLLTGLLSAPDDIGCIYVKDGNLYYNNGSGSSVQITAGTSVLSAVSGAFTATTPGAYPYTVGAGDAQRVLLVDTTATRTINLPLATTAVLFAIKDISGQASTNNISVVPNGTNTIDGVNATKTLNDNFGWTFFISDGVSNWSMGKMRDVITSLQAINATLTGLLTGVNATFAGTAPASQVLIAKAAASQTAPIIEARDSTGTKLSGIGAGGAINLGASPTLTIASGVITVTKSTHKIDTEGAAATDNLDTINGGTDGDILILRTANGARDVTIKNGTGNLRTVGDFTLDFREDRIMLQYDGDLGVWVEVSRSNNV